MFWCYRKEKKERTEKHLLNNQQVYIHGHQERQQSMNGYLRKANLLRMGKRHLRSHNFALQTEYIFTQDLLHLFSSYLLILGTIQKVTQ